MPYEEYRQMTSFEDVDALICPDYEEFSTVSRCLHISDVEKTQRKRMLVPQPIRNSKALGCNTRVLWFAPTQSMEKHNFYGNVSYVISWKTVLDHMGPHLYLIDQAIYANHAFTRILLTKKNYDMRLQNVNLNSEGSAILKTSNKYFHAANCNCKNRIGHHELQIGIEVTEEDARWLYNRCTVMANNHTKANALMTRQMTRKDGKIKKYAPFKCFLYNTTLNDLCPYPDSLSKVEATLASMNIAFSRSLPLDAISPNEITRVIGRSGSYGQGVVRQHSSHRMPPSSNPTTGFVRMPSNAPSARFISTESSPITSPRKSEPFCVLL